jgi:hypothetical protein
MTALRWITLGVTVLLDAMALDGLKQGGYLARPGTYFLADEPILVGACFAAVVLGLIAVVLFARVSFRCVGFYLSVAALVVGVFCISCYYVQVARYERWWDQQHIKTD